LPFDFVPIATPRVNPLLLHGPHQAGIAWLPLIASAVATRTPVESNE
jgi:hypothetical protein